MTMVDPNPTAGEDTRERCTENDDLVIGLLTSGWTQEEVLAGYPTLRAEEVQACWEQVGDDRVDPTMLHDDIIEELHAHRSAIYDRFHGDATAIFRYYQEIETPIPNSTRRPIARRPRT
jgi:hypothetical protein